MYIRSFFFSGRCAVFLSSLMFALPYAHAQDLACKSDPFSSVSPSSRLTKKPMPTLNKNNKSWATLTRSTKAMRSPPKSFITLQPRIQRASQTTLLDTIGNVQVTDSSGSAKSSTNTAGKTNLVNGDWIRTAANSYVRLLTLDGTFVNVASNSNLKLTQIDKLPIMLELTDGRIESLVNKQEQTPKKKRSSNYQIKTPAVTLSVRGTRFKVEHQAEAIKTNASVEDGLVAVQRSGACEAPILLSQGMGVVATRQSLNVYDMLPAPEILSAPPVIKGDALSVELKPINGAKRYRMQAGYDESSILITDEVESESPKLSLKNVPNGYYFVRFNAIDDHGIEGISDKTNILYQPD